MKKVKLILLLIVLIILIVIGLKYLPRDYKIKYEISNVTVIEKYNYDDKYYSFNFSFNGMSIDYNIQKEYISSKKLITNISLLNDSNCLKINSKLLNEDIICKDNDKYYTSFYDEKDFNKEIDKYENYKIYNLNNHKYYLWNYNYFVYLSNEKKDIIKLFDDDVYKLELSFKNKNNIYIANYDDKYSFDLFYVINTEKNKVSKTKLNIDLYFDSYVLGEYNKYVYIYDKQKETEYRIDLNDGETIKNNYEYYNNGKWIGTTKNKLNKGNISFIDDSNFYYSVDNGLLVFNTPNYKLNTSNIVVDYLVDSNNYEAFFISGDTLYYVNIYSGINKVLSCKEWKYNQSNVFVF